MENQISEHLSTYELKKAHLIRQLESTPNAKILVRKKTASNLFRYIYQKQEKEGVFITNFDSIISLDEKNLTLDVEGSASYETIVTYTLSRGFLPTVAPELKDITIGGAIVGIGIESTSYRYGFVHDGLLEAEVILPDGKIILCTPNNEYADLFYALPNSYGTLGYILRAKIKLYPAKPYIQIDITRCFDTKSLFEQMHTAISNNTVQFIESLIFSKNEFYLLTSHFTHDVNQLDDIYHKTIFYKLVQKNKMINLTAKDYIFRYDPDWFWNIPETFFYNFLRKILPKSLRHSGLYKKYLDKRNKLFSFIHYYPSLSKEEEALIQDWQVPWERGVELLNYALNNIDLGGKPWAALPIKPIYPATLYPLKPNELYFNLGCYCSSKRIHKDAYYNTKLMDDYCFKLNGLKMLYSSTFLSLTDFESRYNGEMFNLLKNKYDPKGKINTLYEKAVKLTEK